MEIILNIYKILPDQERIILKDLLFDFSKMEE
jgi:hypothetical protein